MRRYFTIWLIIIYVLTSAQNVVAVDQKGKIDSVERDIKSVNWIKLEHVYENNQFGRTVTIEPQWADFKIGSITYNDVYNNNKYSAVDRTVTIEPQWADFKIGSITYNDIYNNNKYSAVGRTVTIEPQWTDFKIGSITYNDIYNNKYWAVDRSIKMGGSWIGIEWNDIAKNNNYIPYEKNFNIGPFKWKGTYDIIKGKYSITYIPNRPISSYNNRNYFPYHPTPFEIMQRENYLKYGCCRQR